MKHLKLFMLALCLLGLSMKSGAQNLILNPGFETGPIPTTEDQVPYATNWEKGCAGVHCANCPPTYWNQGSPDLFDVRSSSCAMQVPVNKWGSRNVRTAGTNRYVGFAGTNNASGLAYFGESVKGKLAQALVSGCTYSISFWASAIDGVSQSCAPLVPQTPSTNTKMEVVLRKDGDCTNLKIVYMSGSITQQTWTNFASTFTLTPAEAAFGYNKVEFRLYNNYPMEFPVPDYSHSVYLDDVSLSATPLTLSITGNTAFCYNDPLSFIGASNLTLGYHFWEIAECDIFGNYTDPTASWNQWFTGTPGPFTFTQFGFITCGRYYKIKLAANTECNGWTEVNKIIFINCNPVINAGPDVTICAGNCATIGTPGLRGITYQWFTTVGTTSVIVGNTAQITVCPRSTTTYTLMATNSAGCTSTDQVTVVVEDNDPSFSLSSNLNPADGFYTLFASPVINPLPAGAGFSWFVDEIVSPTNTTVITGSSANMTYCWWSTLNCNFNGYDGPLFTNTGTGPMVSCSSPSVGHFTVGHTYRIIRGTWSDVCPWQQYSQIVYMTHSLMGDDQIEIVEDTDAPDYSYMKPVAALKEQKPVGDLLTVYPNPGSGLFTITINHTGPGTIEVYDALNKKVQTIVLQNNTTDYKLDLSGYSKGMYMLNVLSDDKLFSKKIIVE